MSEGDGTQGGRGLLHSRDMISLLLSYYMLIA